jgi:hypothetical protein
LRDDEGDHASRSDPGKGNRAMVTAGLANDVDAVNQ